MVQEPEALRVALFEVGEYPLDQQAALSYGRGVARVGNVLLVLDTSIWNNDGRTPQWLNHALNLALPHYYYENLRNRIAGTASTG